jgi:hypothetical protein
VDDLSLTGRLSSVKRRCRCVRMRAAAVRRSRYDSLARFAADRATASQVSVKGQERAAEGPSARPPMARTRGQRTECRVARPIAGFAYRAVRQHRRPWCSSSASAARACGSSAATGPLLDALHQAVVGSEMLVFTWRRWLAVIKGRSPPPPPHPAASHRFAFLVPSPTKYGVRGSAIKIRYRLHGCDVVQLEY